MNQVVESFNKFFVSVGPDLAEQIPDPVTSEEQSNSLIDQNLSSMFLTAVDEKEIINTVTKCANKTSEDFDDIDMSVVKIVIEGISKPLTYICNL